MNLVNVLKSAAQGYGTERRVLLLHGPVGSSKSTIARLLKKGLEHYSQTDDGALYTFGWQRRRRRRRGPLDHCPMHEEPLHLIPAGVPRRRAGRAQRRASSRDDFRSTIEGDLCPVLPPDVQRAAGAATTATGPRCSRTSGSAA